MSLNVSISTSIGSFTINFFSCAFSVFKSLISNQNSYVSYQ
jgi:hypothetical protein